MINPPKPGHVIYYDHARPPLPSGDYELEVGQAIDPRTATNSQVGASFPPPSRYPFSVVGPRFTLDPAEIHSVYPPAKARGPFMNRLPNVVLRRRTLPWERRLSDSNAQAPWLALLLIDQEEIDSGAVTLLEPPNCTVAMILDGDSTNWIDPPQMPAQSEPITTADRAQKCLGLEITRALFEKIAPLESELSMLTHVRQVNTDDKELLGMDEDGWFAVIISNRLPQPGHSYVACLVSLEGLREALPAPEDTPWTDDLNDRIDPGPVGPAIPVTPVPPPTTIPVIPQPRPPVVPVIPGVPGGPGVVINAESAVAERIAPAAINFDEARLTVAVTEYNFFSPAFRYDVAAGLFARIIIPKIRLFVLARWDFACEGEGDFEFLMKNLPRRGGVAMLGAAPGDALAPDQQPDARFNVALQSGHVPLTHTTRAGETTAAWYRGPLTPIGVARETGGPYHTSDQARRVDPLTGLENLGYAAAFEIGRLLALSDPRFSLALLNWRRSGNQRLVKHITLTYIETMIRDIFARLNLRLPMAVVQSVTDSVFSLVRGGEVLPMRDPSGLVHLQGVIAGLDPEVWTQVTRGAAESILTPSIVGAGETLSLLNLNAARDLTSDFGALADGFEAEFGHLSALRGDLMRNLGENGEL
jgi:hypothetical protein